jgi:hypothetical protein
MSESIDPFCQPSLPLTKKWRAPNIACVAMFYSEDNEQVYHVFDTEDLHHSLATKSRYQSAALRQDPSVRVAWFPCEAGADRQQLKDRLRRQFRLEIAEPSV